MVEVGDILTFDRESFECQGHGINVKVTSRKSSSAQVCAPLGHSSIYRLNLSVMSTFFCAASLSRFIASASMRGLSVCLSVCVSHASISDTKRS